MTDQQPAAAVLDASAVLAYLHQEPGGEITRAAMRGAVISTVNWSEVAQKILAEGNRIEPARVRLEALGLRVIPFLQADAEAAAAMWSTTKPLGLSLADRACLALGQRLGRPVLTTDRRWNGIPLGVNVQVLR